MLILADDLSGAADCGIACVESGLGAIAVFRDVSAPPKTDVLCIDADSRHLPAAQAAAITGQLLRRHAGVRTVVYKKMDSTLRGNVGAEIAAALDALRDLHPDERPVVIAAPAYPQTGRVTRKGLQYLHGKPVEETEVWQGQKGRADLIALITKSGLSAALFSLAQVRASETRAEIMTQACKDHDVLVCDAETDDDLAAIARAGREMDRPVLWAGSGGLARHLPDAYALKPGQAPAEQPQLVDLPLLFVVGTRSSVSYAQADRLAGHGAATAVTVPAAVLEKGRGRKAWNEQQAHIRAAFSVGGDVLVRLGEDDVVAPDSLCEGMALLVAPFVMRCGGLFLTGGETAHAVLKAVGAAGVRLVDEVEPGISLSIVQGGDFSGYPIVIKAGAFGSPDAMLSCQSALHGNNAALASLATSKDQSRQS